MGKILIVDDDEQLLDMLCIVSRIITIEPIGVKTIKEALKVADYDMIDLAVVDVILPDGRGTDLIKTLKSKHGAKTILITGHTQHLECWANDCEPDAYLNKPIDVNDFADLVFKLI
jgi:Response regulator containing CheY-like receiver, AAA-type ATPase, and DNA-binding domains